MQKTQGKTKRCRSVKMALVPEVLEKVWGTGRQMPLEASFMEAVAAWALRVCPKNLDTDETVRVSADALRLMLLNYPQPKCVNVEHALAQELGAVFRRFGLEPGSPAFGNFIRLCGGQPPDPASGQQGSSGLIA